jgi:hypothetical protein
MQQDRYGGGNLLRRFFVPLRKEFPSREGHADQVGA